ncbi:FecCD family ABC transporter permease [Staphylococcus agnetis]|uniref:FecCD family ABC transporter permease n=1 Tax=Staphylococcus agnetis TaxID=985762 RepID=UPI0004E33C3B|nr:iron ABC transporter permease [Staphylococcus agnetis]KFE41257.1 iron compound ABC transporter permease [Staphylococcus agnetis]NJH66452.1 iron chelate uptake ABC transporter family permease subunit [Staphylococcus agnetis]NJH98569.1 iron chelate uptake ABC transporter family permease subunit [Staphylococcus agnetis]PTH46732.1 iron ABC transporter permease [Staphylococcus agnetis]PTH73210.1 iron ABC transporter permease [Staphylococcus agnetis]
MSKLSHSKFKEYHQGKRTTLTFIVSVCFLIIAIYLNLAIGASKISFQSMLDYMFQLKDTKDTFLIHNVRMPRMLAAILIGAALAVAGVLMQSITRNPLASPQIFGVNAGASFVVVLITVLLPSLAQYTVIYAFLGAFIGGLTVYLLAGTTRGMTPVKLALAGMTIHLFFTSLTQGIILLNEDATTTVMFWLVGALHTIKWPDVLHILPWIMTGLVMALFLGRQLAILELGDELAKGLGQNTQRVRAIAGLIVVVLAGACVSIAGPIGFVGLIVPHIVKYYLNRNYFLIILLSMIIGANLLLISDVVSRLIAFPFESPVGIVTSFIGALYFLWITMRGVKAR